MEQRKFKRFPLQCQLEVRGENRSGHPFCESTELINISGGGALFYSLQTDRYIKGQVVEANIMLPGTPEIRGRMKTTATVVSVQNMQDSSNTAVSDRIQIAVHFMEPLRLMRNEAPSPAKNQREAMASQ
jgi:hypothetical protein